jgi:outer membrane protein assembly factor BamB
VGVLLAVAAVAVGVAPPPPPPLLVEVNVPARAGDFLAVQDDRMYVITPDARQPGVSDRTIAAYALPDGDHLWHVALPVTAQVSLLVRAGGGVILQAYDTEAVEVVALDERTGRVWWRRPASFLGVTPVPSAGGQPWLLLGSIAALTDPDDDAQHDVITAVDIRTGGTAWSYRPPPGAQAWPVWRVGSSEVSRMVTALPSGRAEVRDLTTGSMIAAATLRQPVAPMSPEAQDPWLSAEEELVLVNGAPDGRTVTAYGLDRLDRRWTADWRMEIPGWYIGSACGPLLCLTGGDGVVRAVERDSGRIRWQANWLWAEPWGGLLLASSGRGSAATQRLVLLDPDTGRVRQELGRWGLAGRAGGEAWIVVRRDQADSKAWFGLLDPSVPDVQLLGSATGVGDCRAGRDSVVCWRIGASIGIWRYW